MPEHLSACLIGALPRGIDHMHICTLDRRHMDQWTEHECGDCGARWLDE